MSTTTTWTLGELIAKARRDARLEQTDLADAIGVSRNTVSNYERGRSMPPLDVAARIAVVCGVSIEWLASTAVETTTAPAEAEAVGSLSQHSVRPKGLEPLTFWLVADAEREAVDAAFWSIVACQVAPDTEIANQTGAAS